MSKASSVAALEGDRDHRCLEHGEDDAALALPPLADVAGRRAEQDDRVHLAVDPLVGHVADAEALQLLGEVEVHAPVARVGVAVAHETKVCAHAISGTSPRAIAEWAASTRSRTFSGMILPGLDLEARHSATLARVSVHLGRGHARSTIDLNAVRSLTSTFSEAAVRAHSGNAAGPTTRHPHAQGCGRVAGGWVAGAVKMTHRAPDLPVRPRSVVLPPTPA